MLHTCVIWKPLRILGAIFKGHLGFWVRFFKGHLGFWGRFISHLGFWLGFSRSQ